MSSGEIRPRFEVFVEDGAAALGSIATYLETEDCRCEGWVRSPYAELQILEADRHFWSPRLAVYAAPAVAGTNLVCRLQPEPSVWALFAMAWALLGIAGLSCATYGCAQIVMGEAPWVTFVGLPVVGALALLLWVSALAGQRLGLAQMELLREELGLALSGKRAIVVRRGLTAVRE